MAENLPAIQCEQVIQDIKSNNILVKHENGKWTITYIDLGIAGIHNHIDNHKPPITNPFEIATSLT